MAKFDRSTVAVFFGTKNVHKLDSQTGLWPSLQIINHCFLILSTDNLFHCSLKLTLECHLTVLLSRFARLEICQLLSTPQTVRCNYSCTSVVCASKCIVAPMRDMIIHTLSNGTQ